MGPPEAEWGEKSNEEKMHISKMRPAEVEWQNKGTKIQELKMRPPEAEWGKKVILPINSYLNNC